MRKYMSIIVLLLFCTSILFTVGCSSSGAPSTPPASTVSGGTPSTPPASTVSGGTPSTPPASTVSGGAPSTPPASTVSGGTPSTPPASTVSGGTPSTPPASTVSGSTPSTTEATTGGASSDNTASAEPLSKTEMAIAEASKEDKYLFLVFYKQGDQKSEAMKQAAAQAQKEVSTRADAAYVDVADNSEQALILEYNRYGVDESSAPVTLVVAPNGAVVRGFYDNFNFSSDNLTSAFVSPKTAELIKATQDGKLIYLYIASPDMQYYEENLALMQEVIKTYPDYEIQVIVFNPNDQKEASMIDLLQLELPVTEPNLWIAIYGYILEEFTGKISQNQIAQTTYDVFNEPCELPGAG